ncbi:helix-turn-helix domain-containing protein, partial [Actinoplanes philippinensis]|uniref:helix-turn-helix domain-containing protein n=1 Tax=Actinoplanes philippinensis TaxID=35752 RepID=UPI0033E2F7CD
MKNGAGAPLGQLLQAHRVRQGLTQQELAGRAGVSVGAVRDLEQGRTLRPRAGSLGGIADVLALTRDDRLRLAELTRADSPSAPPPAGPVRIAILGPLTVSRGTTSIRIGAGRHRTVLARLALTPSRSVGLDELITLLWGETAPPAAANVVQTHVSRLRRLLAPETGTEAVPTVVWEPGGYVLRADDDAIDLLAYRTRLARAADPAVPPHQAFDLLCDALDRWRADCAAQDVPELAGDPLVTALTEQRVAAAIRLARLGETLRQERQVLPVLRGLARA